MEADPVMPIDAERTVLDTVSLAERERREGAVRAAMRDHEVDLLVLCGNAEATQRGFIRYLSDWRLWGGNGFLVFPSSEAPTLVLGSGSQAYWAQQVGWVDDVRSALDKVEEVVRTVRAHAPRRVGVVGMAALLSHGDAERLVRDLAGVEVVDATDLMNGVMVVKSAEEIGHVRHTYALVAEALGLVREALAPGRTEVEVMSEAIGFLARHACLDGIAHISHHAGPFIHPPTFRTIRADDVIKVSLEFAGPSGHWIELAAIHSFREPPPRDLQVFQTTCRAVDAAVAGMRPGVAVGDLSRTIQRTFEEDGWELAGRAIWDIHSIGVNVIEPPIGLPEHRQPLREHMVLNIHPGWMVAPDRWGVYVQNNVLVTEAGGEILGDYAYTWHVLER
jgi:Xaa-Pro aminopeptidase